MRIMKEPILYRTVTPIVRVLFKLIYRPTLIGTEYIPKKGRVVLAGNHTNNFDCLLLMTSTKRCIHFLAKQELVHGKFGFIFKHMGIIPVNRRVKDKHSLDSSRMILNQDGVIGIFPEGTFNRTEELTLPFKMGAVKMAADTNSPIVPFVIIGQYRPFHKGLTIQFLKPYQITNKDLEKENKKLMNMIRNVIQERNRAHEHVR